MTPEERQAKEDGNVLGRIEEGIKGLTADLTLLKADIKSDLRKVFDKTYNHEVEIAGLKRDRKWILGLAILAGGFSGHLFDMTAPLLIQLFHK